jgi:hypothetical protein
MESMTVAIIIEMRRLNEDESKGFWCGPPKQQMFSSIIEGA